jgi:hypothetical protein
LLNEKCRAGWELYGVYAASDGSEYRVLFKIPCPERELLDSFARETALSLQRLKNERQRVARALLKDLSALDGVLGLTVRESAKDARTVSHAGTGEKSAEVKIDDDGKFLVQEREVPLWFNSDDGILEPEDSAKTKGGVPQTALSVLIGQILARIK